MPSIRVTVPGLLRHTLGGAGHTTLDAATLPELLVAVKRAHPLLVPLIWDETGAVRKHVLIFLNDTATKWMDDENVTLNDGDQLSIVQAVSGG